MNPKHRLFALRRIHVAALAAGLWLFGSFSVLASGDPRSTHLALEGSRLAAEEASQLELLLVENPDDLTARIRLLGYYGIAPSDDAREARFGHVLWIIRNHPGSSIAGTPFARVDAILENDSYELGKSSWMQQVELHGGDARVHGNAAKFFLVYDQELAKELLEKARVLDPASSEWPQQLAHLYSLGLLRVSGAQKSKDAAYSLQLYEKALTLADEMTRGAMLAEVAKMAIATGELDKARSYAVEMVSGAGESSWNHGNLVHQGNLILGRLALRSGDIEVAKLHLIQAGKTPGSPQLNSFGPNMLLAKELLEQGEQESVLEYFELCREFWRMAGERLDSWATDVREGRTPDFGANLKY